MYTVSAEMVRPVVAHTVTYDLILAIFFYFLVEKAKCKLIT